MNAPAALPTHMTAAEFLSWSDDQGSTRFELIEGAVVAMAPERISHAQRKLELCLRLRSAIAEAKLPCEAFVDGPGVAPDDRSVFIPDAIVRCGDPLDPDTMIVPDPVILVEVLSPSTQAVDLTFKLEQYFRLPSLEHYLVARTNTSGVQHYRRSTDGFSVQIVGRGPLRLDPPGLTVQLD